MEQRERFRLKLDILKKAELSFETTININLSDFNLEVSDAIKNGSIQKFEYCTELIWKTVKEYLSFIHGIETKSPKKSIKELFLLDVITSDEYESLLEMLDDRNKLSHIYKEEFFNEIHSKLHNYLNVMLKVENILEKEE